MSSATPDTLELAMIAVILIGIVVAIWRGGAANPESTGALGRKLGAVERQVQSLGTSVSAIDLRVTEIDRRTATTADIDGVRAQLHSQGQMLAAVDDSIAQTREQVARQQATAEHTCKQVDRLYDFLVERGIKG